MSYLAEVACGDPGFGDNVIRSGVSLQYDDIVVYRCVPQHVLIGGGLEELRLRCTSQSTWNGTAPSCERKLNMDGVDLFTFYWV